MSQSPFNCERRRSGHFLSVLPAHLYQYYDDEKSSWLRWQLSQSRLGGDRRIGSPAPDLSAQACGLVGLVCFGVAHAQAPLVLTDLAELIARLTRRSQLMCWVGSKARWDHLTWDIPSLERGIDGPPMRASDRTVR